MRKGILATLLLLPISVFAYLTVQQVIGYYSDGKLQNATELPLTGPGYMRLFVSRDRGWGTDGLIEIIETTAAEMAALYPEGERLGVGDLSIKTGGKITRHASHQVGLDVDLNYYHKDLREMDPNYNNGFDEEFVINGELTRNFDMERNWKLIKLLTDTGKVARIFVDAVIKQSFCDYTRTKGEYEERIETLRKLRAWPYHGNHLHVRLHCPTHEQNCREQTPPPQGSGCDNIKLDWYL